MTAFLPLIPPGLSLLVLGAFERVRTLVVLAGARVRGGLPYGWTAAILGVVAAVCFASAPAFRAAPVRRWFRFGTPSAE